MGQEQSLTQDNTALPAPADQQALFLALHAALPQTQCTRCGYPDCAAYARAIAADEAEINQCPPGGTAGVQRLARITGRTALPLNPQHGTEGPRRIAIIDESWCTGCELCIPVCPVDCIALENVTGERTGWDAWSQPEADTALHRYTARQARLAREDHEHAARQIAKAEMKLADLPAHTQGADGAGAEAQVQRKRAIIEAALAKARAKQSQP